MLVWWLWATAGDTTEGYLGGAVKTWVKMTARPAHVMM